MSVFQSLNYVLSLSDVGYLLFHHYSLSLPLLAIFGMHITFCYYLLHFLLAWQRLWLYPQEEYQSRDNRVLVCLATWSSDHVSNVSGKISLVGNRIWIRKCGVSPGSGTELILSSIIQLLTSSFGLDQQKGKVNSHSCFQKRLSLLSYHFLSVKEVICPHDHIESKMMGWIDFFLIMVVVVVVVGWWW